MLLVLDPFGKMEDKIEQFCLLAKGARGRALVDLIHRATAEPGLFVFGEILDIDSVKEVGHGASIAFCWTVFQASNSEPRTGFFSGECSMCAFSFSFTTGKFAST